MPRREIYMPDGFSEKLEKMAKEKDLSVSALIRYLYDQELKRK